MLSKSSGTESRPAAGRLFVVATPIGNLEDITLRALKILRESDLIAAEDTRHTRKLLAAHGIENRLTSYHEHNESRRTPELIERLRSGTDIALVSNAGTPMVSDPGYRLVQAALARRIAVIPVPGVSAAITALCASGLEVDSFSFIGFPPRAKIKRMQQLEALAGLSQTLIFYQSPRRLPAFLEEARTVLGDRPAVLAREMTKHYEEFLRGRLSDIIAALAARDRVRGECTLLIGGARDRPQHSTEALEQAIRDALARNDAPLSEMAKILARRFNRPRKEIYKRALELRDQWK